MHKRKTCFAGYAMRTTHGMSTGKKLASDEVVCEEGTTHPKVCFIHWSSRRFCTTEWMVTDGQQMGKYKQ